MSRTDFIDLNRKFIKISEGTEGEDTLRQLELLEYVGGSTEKNWRDLLQQPRAVVLGEPGSGKTQEFKHQSELLRNAGRYSFCIDLQELVDSHLSDLLSRKDGYLKEFNEWASSREPVWFFLDAIDESKLKYYKDFRRALENFAYDIPPASRSRIHVILSSRISAWQSYSDRDWLDSFLSQSLIDSQVKIGKSSAGRIRNSVKSVAVAVEGGKAVWLPFKLFALTPLTLKQIEIFVNHRNANGQEFCKALTDQFLDSLARRPIDVDYLLQYWKDKSRFDSYLDVLKNSISHQLKEPSEDASRDILAPERVRQGVETLAATVLFCRDRDFSLSARSSGNDLNAREALPESWKDEEIKSLFDRAIFDVPVFGRVRFHHRQTEEFLAARWLFSLVLHNLPLNELKRKLFSIVPNGRLILRPSLAPVAAWLGCMDSEAAVHVRGWIKEASPELYFQYGDPASLPAAYRKSLLEDVVASYSGWEFSRIDVDRAALTRFAHTDMIDFLAMKVVDKALPEDLRSKFFYMAIFGKLRGLESCAISIILDDEESSYLKESACNYLEDIASEAALSKLAEDLNSITAPSEPLAASLLSALFPAFVSKDQAIALIKRLGGVEKYSTGFCYLVARDFKGKKEVASVILLMEVLIEVMLDGPPWYRRDGEKYEVGSKFVGLGNLLLTLLPIAITKTNMTAVEEHLLGQALWLVIYLKKFGDIHNFDKIKIPELLSSKENIKRAYLHYTLEMRKRTEHGLKNLEWSGFIYDEEPMLNINDARWLIEDAKTVEPDIASVLLRVVNRLWWVADTPRSVSRDARSVVKKLKNEGAEDLPTFPVWVIRKWHEIYGKLYRTIGQKFWWSSRVNRILDKWRWWRNQWALLRMVRTIRQGKNEGALWFLIHELEERDLSHLTRTGWEDLRKSRGGWVASAARRGVINYWPLFTPTLRHERPAGDNSIDGGVIIGLTGIQEAIAANELNFSVVSEAHAQQLVRYALNEINGFPDWFVRLVETRYEAVRNIVMSVVEHEWQLSMDHESVHGVLAGLSYDQTGVSQYFINTVAQVLENSDPVHPSVLDQALRLLCRNFSATGNLLRTLAAKRVKEYDVEASQHMAWMNINMQFNAQAALDVLENAVKKAKNPKSYLIRLAAALGAGGRFNEPVVAEPSYLTPQCLKQLIPLMFQYLPPVDDPVHPSGAMHRITDLDEAVRFRDGLLTQLAGLETPEANKVLEAFLDESLFRSHHDWIRHLLLEQCRRSADMVPWKESDIRSFQEKHEIAPRNPSELFDLICARMLDIKEWVEKGEDSPRGNLHAGSQEKDVRIWLAEKLKDKARGFYSVPEEQEIVSGKKQDIRIAAPDIPGPVIVEVKQVEGSSYPKLRERLENQLVGDYLKAPNANYGIFLISYTGHKGKGSRGYDPATGQHFSFQEVIQQLQNLANDLVKNKSGVKGLKVFGIDFVTM